MTYRAQQIADWFIANIDRDAGDSITHLKLQKLLYYAQAWFLALNGKPLFNEEIQAWTHGPVVEPIFRKYRECGWDSLPPVDRSPKLDADAVEHLKAISELYGDFSAKHLELMTHKEKPWLAARGNIPLEARSDTVIDRKTMKEYYKHLFEQNVV